MSASIGVSGSTVIAASSPELNSRMAQVTPRMGTAPQDQSASPSPALLVTAPTLNVEGYGTDLDAALRFAEGFRDVLRYAHGVGWLFWDGKRWLPNSKDKAVLSAMVSARSWSKDSWASAALDQGARAKTAKGLEGAARIENAVRLSESLPQMRVDHWALDQNKWLLNCQNGTLDLRTGELYPHRPTDFITKLAPVTYDAAASSDALELFLRPQREVHPEMPDFLARCFGATLTGDVSAESLFLLQGEGGSGKTTLTESVAAMLGDYACKLPFESLCKSKHGRQAGGATPDLVPIRGARLVYATEGDASSQLDSGRVKELTGGEPITVRALYQEPVHIQPTWKIWLVSNFDPRTDSEDTGLWRRLVKLSFTSIPEHKRDPKIKEALLNDHAARSALLAWAVQGCLDWQRRGAGRAGLAIPKAIADATEAYRTKQDLLGSWWEDLTSAPTTLPQGWTPTQKIRAHYYEWCCRNGSPAFSWRRLSEYLERRGLRASKGSGGERGWDGISI
jgi:putative DNA primase/helicase